MNDYSIDGFVPSEDNSFTNTHSFQNEDATIFDIAHAFLAIESMTHKKLQKLCYYAKAWYLAINDANLVKEQFEAWIHGAVQPELYQKYRSYGFSYIPMYGGKDIPEEFMNFAKEVYSAYGEFDGDELEKINHQEYPWIHARANLKPWQSCTNIISEDDMKSFYRGQMEDEQN